MESTIVEDNHTSKLCGCCGPREASINEENVEAIRRDLRRLESILGNYDAREDHDQLDEMGIEQLRLASFKAADALERYEDQLTREDVDAFYDSLYGILTSIKNLKSHGNDVASEIKHVRSTIIKLSNEIDRLENKLRNLPLPRANLKEDAPLLEEDDVVGIEEPRTKLIGWLLKDDGEYPRPKVISVVGMGGTGKTTLVKKVFDDVIIKKSFRYHVWTTISRSFTIEELLREIIRQIYTVNRQPIPEGVYHMRSSYLKSIVKNLLHQNPFLLVLDDVWSIRTWDAIKEALPKVNRSRVLLTTRDFQIALTASVESNAEIHTMDKLSPEDSKILFCRKAFQDGGGRCPAHLQETVGSILTKCDGLPLAIISIAGFLRNKETTSHQWEMAYRNLGFELRMNQEFAFTKKTLSLSYNELPRYLKSCFLYLSMFPEDYTIEYNRLIRLWIAENFVQPPEGRTMEEAAVDYFKVLLNKNLIQVAETSSDGRAKSCHLHDIMHKICILKSKDQKFAAIHKDNRDATWPNIIARRLSIHNTFPDVDQIRENSLLRALLVFGLDAPLKQFPREITKLVHLRYLSLRHTKVEEIPSSISKLKNLETLDLKHAHEGFKSLGDIGKMTSLQKLCFFEAAQGRRHVLTTLGNLSKLRRLGVINLRKEDGTALWSSVRKLSQLRALSITSVDEEEIIDLPDDKLSPHRLQYLQRLYLTGPLKKLPNWVSMVTSLVRLSLKWSRLNDDPLEHLQNLPELVHLELLQVHSGEKLHFKNGGFKKLKVLGLDKFDQLKMIRVDEGALASLEKLIIQRCMMLEEVPIGIEHLTKIKVLQLFDMPQELIMRLRPYGPDNWKITHIPQAYSTYSNGGWESHSLKGSLYERESIINLCWK
ncbi:Disease resistance protein [Corchorus olitorius]|uniref:Disease resistance protein n=1 Tax=Corchorus olitorius TaxID=93759 RepID=A0A1R3HFS6_9ROSI|nr:Disease resistance protein [Corchorus olitorius]